MNRFGSSQWHLIQLNGLHKVGGQGFTLIMLDLVFGQSKPNHFPVSPLISNQFQTSQWHLTQLDSPHKISLSMCHTDNRLLFAFRQYVLPLPLVDSLVSVVHLSDC